MNAFVLDEKTNSRTHLGLRITEPPKLPSAKRIVDYIPVEGREGSLTLYKGWEDITFSLRAALFGGQLEEKYREILPTIHAAQTIYFSGDPKVIYRVKHVSSGSTERILPSAIDFPLSFVCEPFRYLRGVATISLSSSGSTVTNPGTVYSRPKITVYGTGQQTLTINGTQTRLNILSGNLVLDSELMECYRGSTAQNNQMQGPFPILATGTNSINWSSGITNISIEPRWRYL